VEIVAGEPALVIRRALLKAQAKDYPRRSQARLIVRPLLDQLRGSLGSVAAVTRRLLELLDAWRGQAEDSQGHGTTAGDLAGEHRRRPGRGAEW
jgi:hypothetical protein